MESEPPERSHPNHRIVGRRDRPTIVFVTVCTRDRRPILANDVVHDALRALWSSATAWIVGRYVIMPDHVHLFATPGDLDLPLTNWIAFWKRMYARRAREAIWQDDYWDTTLRSAPHYDERSEYMEHNPVRRGLVVEPRDWPYRGEINRLAW